MKTTPIPHQQVFVIGAGMVGSTAAYTLLTREVAREIVLLDIHHELAHGHVVDMNHASAFTSGIQVRTGDYSEIRENDIIVITSGTSQKSGEDRHAATESNIKIIKEVLTKVMANGVAVYIVMVTNPVDVLTYVACKETGLPRSRVFGTGTALDTARLRYMLSERMQVNPANMVAFILGEHGDTSFPALSAATVEGIPIQKYTGFKKEYIANITKEVREAGYKIVEEKKATYYGIGSTVADVVEAVINDKQKVYSLSCVLDGEYGLHNLATGVPALLSNAGVKVLEHYPLNEEEMQALKKSSQMLQESIKKLGY
jgi:L-lactate dehydrogenase